MNTGKSLAKRVWFALRDIAPQAYLERMAQAQPSFVQDLAWRLEALGFDLVTGLARAFPIDLVSDFGAWLFQRLGPLTSAHRVAETNIRIVFPEASDAEVAALL